MKNRSRPISLIFIRDNSRLMSQFKELLSYHYSYNIFTDHTARLNYVEPDLAPF